MDEVFKVKKTAWHYRWMIYYYAIINYHLSDNSPFGSYADKSKWSSYQDYFDKFEYLPYNFCRYWRCVLLWPMIRLLINVFIMASPFIILCLAGFKGLGHFSFVVLIFFAIVFIGASLICLSLYGMTRMVAKVPNSDKFFRTIYSSFHKFCPGVEYDKDDY